MIKWDTFMPEVLPDLPGAPYDTVVNALRNAAIEFAEQSLILRKDLSLINVVKDLQDYPAAAGAKLRTIAPLRVEFDEVAVTPLQEDTKYRRTGTTQEFPYQYRMDGPELIHLEWKPDKNLTDGLFARITYKPLPTADECDDILYYDWHEYIACGAKARMQINPDKPWSSAPNARINHSTFHQGITKAWARAQKNHTNSTTRVQFTPMSGGSRRGDQIF